MHVDGEGTMEGRDTPVGADQPFAEVDPGTRADEFAAMRETVARQYADALGRRYEPPDELPGESSAESGAEGAPGRPRFDRAEVDRDRVASDVFGDRDAYRSVTVATGLSRSDTDRVADQIRAGAAKGPAVGDGGGQWHVDVPLTGPHGTITVRTSWTLEAGTDRPRLTTIAVPTARGAARDQA